MKQILSLLLLACLHIPQAHALIESVSIYCHEKTDTQLCLIGDLHDIDYNTDTLHKKILLNCIDTWSKESTPTLILLECNERSFQNYRKKFNNAVPGQSNHYTPMYYDLAWLAKKHNFSMGSTHFYFADIRKAGISQFFTGFYVLKDMAVVQQVTNIRNMDMFTFNNRLKQDATFRTWVFKENGLFSVIKKQIPRSIYQVSAQQYLDEIEQYLNAALAYRQYDAKSPEAHELEALYRTLFTCRKRAEAFFKRYLTSLNQPAILALLNAIEKEQSYEPFFDMYMKWGRDLSCISANVGFLVQILSNQHKYKRIVLVAGNNHTCAMQCLLKMGYKPIIQNGLLTEEPNAMGYNGPIFKQEELKQILSQAFQTKITSSTIQQTSNQSSSSSMHHTSSSSNDTSDVQTSKQVEKVCAVCKTTGELQRCSRCKKVHYCSVACQRKAWPVHKKVCNK